MWDDKQIDKAAQQLCEALEELGLDIADVVVLDYKEGIVSSASVIVEKVFIAKRMGEQKNEITKHNS